MKKELLLIAMITAVGYMNTVSGSVFAADTTVGTGNGIAYGTATEATGVNSIAIGHTATATGNYTVAIGSKASAADYDSIAIGKNASASKAGTVVIGRNAKSDEELSLAVGTDTESVWGGTAVGVLAKATGMQSTALGNGANATEAYSTAVGVGAKATGIASTAVGSVVKATGNHSIAVGYAAESAGKQSIAIGTNASAIADKSVAIGSSSKADTVVGTASLNIAGNTYNFAGATPIGTISIGDADKERTITNVAAGRVSATSTDAVNGSQLHAIKDVVDNHENRITTIEGDINTLNNRIINGGANSLNEAKAYTDQQVSSVAAASAALAGLHPLDFDKHDKWSYSVGFGNYKNASAAALGAFYRPNKNTMFNAATTVGNGRNTISLGANFKFGKSSEEVTTEEATQLKKDMKDLSEKYNELAQKYNELAAKLESK